MLGHLAVVHMQGKVELGITSVGMRKVEFVRITRWGMMEYWEVTF
jgi:hypothetical protein